jgi:TPR repeat protein
MQASIRLAWTAMALLVSATVAQAQGLPAAAAEQAYQDALRLQQGTAGKADPSAAAEAFRRAADAGHAGAACAYADILLNGRGVATSLNAANVYAERAASAGVAACMVLYGDSLLSGRGGLAKDAATAFQWYEKAAGAGDVRGQARAGEALRTGNGVAADLPRAVALLKPAADRQDPDAMVSLGFIHATAKGELARRDEGLRLLRAAADAHVPEAEIRLGELLAFGGDGINPEPEEGRKWLMLAASRKDTRGALGLARIYRDGLGVKADWNEAAKWAQAGYRNGNWSGAVFIGRMLQKGGPNMDKDVNEALQFYKRAYGEGYAPALTAIRELLPYKTTVELMAMADEAARSLYSQMSIAGRSENSRRYSLGIGKIVNVQAVLQANGNMHLTVQASDVELLKSFFQRYVVRHLHELENHDAWLLTRTQVLN